jgi:hypothetical protein
MFVEVVAQIAGCQPHHRLEIDLTLRETGTYCPAFVAVDIVDSAGTVIMQALPRTCGFLTANGNGHSLRVTVELPPLIPGVYAVTAWVGPSHSETYDLVETAVSFTVHESPSKNRTIPHSRDHGFLVPRSTLEQLSF